MTKRRVADQPFANLTPAVARRHVRRRPGFIDEDELARVEGRLLLPPCGARGGYVRTLLSAAQSVFFIASRRRVRNQPIDDFPTSTPRSLNIFADQAASRLAFARQAHEQQPRAGRASACGDRRNHRPETSRRSKTLHQLDHETHADAELTGSFTARSSPLNHANHAGAKIIRIRFCHPSRPPPGFDVILANSDPLPILPAREPLFVGRIRPAPVIGAGGRPLGAPRLKRANPYRRRQGRADEQDLLVQRPVDRHQDTEKRDQK